MDSQVAAAGEERGGDRWENSFQEVDESKEKLESVKMAVVFAVVGSCCCSSSGMRTTIDSDYYLL